MAPSSNGVRLEAGHVTATDAETLQRAMDSTSNGVVIASASGSDYAIVYMNAGFERITGYGCDEVVGRDCRFLQGEATDPTAVAELSRAVRNGAECRLTILNYRKDGEPFWNELFLSPIRDAGGDVVQYVGIQNDVSERQEAQEQVQHLAYHDALTGLGNRAKLERDLVSALEAAAAAGESVALLYLDLDDFKGVNDSLGHVSGDELLRQAADRTQRACRPGDLLIRQGGDEFLVLLTGLSEEAEKTASAVAARVAQTMSDPFDLGGHSVTIGASVGISLFPRDAADAETLLTHADTAMYVAKGAGRGRVALYAGEHQTAPHRRGQRTRETPESVQEIIAAGAVRPVYQPIVELRNGAIAGYEALSRGPVGSPLERPDLLFEEARKHGLTAQLDWLCRAEALRGAMEAGLSSPLSLFVNAEPVTLDSPVPEPARAVWERTR
ncbi:MAG TPA: diguanylate cyclase, partial [Thermoleophilaceae bacterium]|nr:diguanylate cyclase [Thermoleophilaceae bacterium]